MSFLSEMVLDRSKYPFREKKLGITIKGELYKMTLIDKYYYL